jgi:hypothetical protein
LATSLSGRENGSAERHHERVRADRYRRVSASLADLNDAALAAALAEAPTMKIGIGGGSTVVDVGGTPVFAKLIPITARELRRPYATDNMFGLPLRCQYGIGGPSFGAWRELAANRIVTAESPDGPFPLLYHWRILPGRVPAGDEHGDVDAVVAKFGGSEAVRTRLVESAGATASLVLFSEFVPHPVTEWLRADRAERFERELFGAVDDLRRMDLLHLDGHVGNMRTDGDRIFLTDFGLATSPRFDLSPAERDFAARNAGHDAGYAAMRLVNWLAVDVLGAPPDPAGRNAMIRKWAAGAHSGHEIVDRHAATAARMNDFSWRLFDGEDLSGQ